MSQESETAEKSGLTEIWEKVIDQFGEADSEPLCMEMIKTTL